MNERETQPAATSAGLVRSPLFHDFLQAAAAMLLSFLLIGRAHPFFYFSIAFWAAAALRLIATPFLPGGAAPQQWLSGALKRFCFLYFVNCGGFLLFYKGLSLPRTFLYFVPLIVCEVVYILRTLLPESFHLRHMESARWATVVIKLLVPFCFAVAAAGLDRSAGKSDPIVMLTFALTFLLMAAIVYPLSLSGVLDRLRRHRLRFHLFTGGSAVVMAWMVSGYCTNPLDSFFTSNSILTHNYLSHDITVFCILVMFWLLYALACDLALPFVRRFLQKIDGFERNYLVISLTVYTLVALLLLVTTNGFTHPLNETFTYDNIFTSDSRVLTSQYYNVYSCVGASENDIRQILFGVAALPMSVFAFLFANLASLINTALGAQYYFWHLYGVGIMLIQCLMMSLIGVMLKRILCTFVNPAFAKLFTVGFALLYSSVVFTFIVEQYMLGLFTLMFLVYTLLCDYSETRTVVGMTYATGTMTPSASSFLMLFLADRKCRTREIIRTAAKTIGLFLLLCLLFGQLYQLTTVYAQLDRLINGFGGVKIAYPDKIRQYFEFLSNSFFAPGLTTAPAYADATGIRIVTEKLPFLIGGIVIFVLALFGGVAGCKKPAVRVAAYWVLISIGVLVVVGWGAPEHGMLLYSSYFMWAFVILLASAFQFLFRRWQKAGCIVLSCALVPLAVYNLYGFYRLAEMVCQYYPAV